MQNSLPNTMHLQPAAKVYNIKKGSYPTTEKIAKSTISLPVHNTLIKRFKIND